MLTDLQKPRTKLSRPLAFVIRTVIPFLLPFIMNISTELIADELKWAGLIVCAITVFFVSYRYIERPERESQIESFEETASSKAFSYAYDINREKRDYYVNRAADCNYKLIPEGMPYDVQAYIGTICRSFESLMEDITGISKEYMSVTFISRFTYPGVDYENGRWKWLVGKEPTMTTPINDFIKNPSTVYYKLISQGKTSVFYNDKLTSANNSDYYMSDRDKRHNKIGSIFGVRMAFSNYSHTFAEGIIIVSSYGKRFVDEEASDYSAEQFKRLVIDRLFPYFQKLLEAELGMLYFQHLGEITTIDSKNEDDN